MWLDNNKYVHSDNDRDDYSQLTFTCSKSAIETLEKGVE